MYLLNIRNLRILKRSAILLMMTSRERQAALKSQDILVLIKLYLLEGHDWTYEELARELGLASSECHSAVFRLKMSKLLREDFAELRVNRSAAKEFLFYGLPYVFPVKVERVSVGMPVAHSGPKLSDKFVYSSGNVYVWPDAEGKIRGEAVVPLYKSVPFAAKKDSKLYELMSLIEALRVGRAREVKMARQFLEEEFNSKERLSA